jgi:hypothetical protein
MAIDVGAIHVGGDRQWRREGEREQEDETIRHFDRPGVNSIGAVSICFYGTTYWS